MGQHPNSVGAEGFYCLERGRFANNGQSMWKKGIFTHSAASLGGIPRGG
jgi:hypothetical protein